MTKYTYKRFNENELIKVLPVTVNLVTSKFVEFLLSRYILLFIK